MNPETIYQTTPNGYLSALTIAILWLSIITSIFLSIHFPHWLTYGLAILIIGTCQRYFEELSHQANHRNLFKHAKLNDWLDLFFAVPLFYTAKDTREEHIRHHLNLKQEQDKKNYSYDHLAISAKWLNHSWYRLFILYVQPFLGIQAVIECRNIIMNSKTYFFNCYLFHFIVIAILLYFHHVSYYFYYWLIPYFTVFCILYYYSELFTHFGCRGEYLSRDTHHWLVKWIIGPLGFCQYHSLHHIAPKVPCFHYVKITKHYSANRQTLRHTFASMFRLSAK